MPTMKEAPVGWKSRTWETMPTRDWPPAQRGHAAMISRMDADVGRILSAIDQKGWETIRSYCSHPITAPIVKGVMTPFSMIPTAP